MQFLDLGWFQTGLRIVMAWLCSVIYWAITVLYNLFTYVSKVNVLSSDIVEPIYQRVTLILTIIMVFYVTFEFVKFVVQPDGITDKEKGTGKIIYKLIAVVVLIAFVPDIFTGVYKIQNIIVEKNIIGKVILGTQAEPSENFGGTFARSVFEKFYGLANDEYADKKCDDIPCGALVGMNINSLENNGTMPYVTIGLGSAAPKTESYDGENLKAEEAYISFDNGFFAVLVGGFICYILLMYCVDVGVRWAQLIFLQVIAPIPIIGFLAPTKEGMFQKWCKQCLTTFLDLFIRIALINFVLLISNVLLNEEVGKHLFSNLTGISAPMKTFVIIILILGLLLFAQKVPKLLGQLFPEMGAASGKFGLNYKDRLNVPPLAAKALGAGLGGMNKLVKGGITKAKATRKRNNEIREKRRAEGKDTSWKAVNQERRQAAKDARHAAKQNKQANRVYNKEQRQTKAERNELLAAEKELAEARRSGDAGRIANATNKKNAAEAQLKQKRAELQAQQAINQAEQNAERIKNTKGANSAEYKDAQKQVSAARTQLTNIQQQQNNATARDKIQQTLDTQNKTLNNMETKRAQYENNITAAEQKLAAATTPEEKASAQAELEKAVKERDGDRDIYAQEQIIKSSEEAIQQKQDEMTQNEQRVTDAENKYVSAQNALTEAQAKYSAAETQGNDEIKAAEAALENAKQNGDSEQIKFAQQAVNQAKVNKDIAMAKAQSVLTTATSNEATMKTQLQQAKTARDTSNAKLQQEKQDLQQVISTAITARDAQIKDRDKRYIGKQNAIEKTQNKLSAQQQALNDSDAAINEFSNRAKEKYEATKAEMARTQSEKASIENQRYRSVAAANLTGAITGAKIGVQTGWKAEKLENIPKQIKEGDKQFVEQLTAREKWLDAGGTSDIDRIISRGQQKMGISTEAQRIEHEIQTLDAEVKSLERANASETAIIQSADKVKDNNLKKMQEGKLNTKIQKSEEWTMNDGKTKFKVHAGETVSTAYGRAQVAVNTAEQEHELAVKNGGNVQAAEEKLAAAKQMSIQVGKKLHEHSFDQILQAIEEHRKNPNTPDPRTNGEFDAGSVQEAYTTLWNIENSRTNPETVNSMRRLLNPTAFEAYIGQRPIDSFALYDAIDKALKTSTGQRTEKISAKKQASSNLSTSSAYAAAKANDASANSGK